MKGYKEFLTYFLFGSTLYGLIEIAYRNRTHWTMILAGGIVLYGISVISKAYEKQSVFFKCFLGAHKYELLETRELKNFRDEITKIIYINRCSNCGKIKSTEIYTEDGYGRR